MTNQTAELAQALQANTAALDKQGGILSQILGGTSRQVTQMTDLTRQLNKFGVMGHKDTVEAMQAFKDSGVSVTAGVKASMELAALGMAKSFDKASREIVRESKLLGISMGKLAKFTVLNTDLLGMSQQSSEDLRKDVLSLAAATKRAPEILLDALSRMANGLKMLTPFGASAKALQTATSMLMGSDSFKEMGSEGTGMIGGLMDKLTSATANQQRLWSTLSPGFQHNVRSDDPMVVAKAVTQLMQSIDKALPEGIVGQDISEANPELYGAFRDFMPIIREAGNLSEAQLKSAQALLKTKDPLAKSSASLMAGLNDISNAFELAIAPAIDSLATVFEGSILPSLVKMASSLGDLLGKIISPIGEFLKRNEKEITGGAQGAASFVEDKAAAFEAKYMGQEGGFPIDEFLKDAADALVKGTTSLAKTLFEAFQPVFKGLVLVFEKFVIPLISGVFQEVIIPALEKVFDVMLDQVDKVVADAVGLTPDKEETMSDDVQIEYDPVSKMYTIRNTSSAGWVDNSVDNYSGRENLESGPRWVKEMITKTMKEYGVTDPDQIRLESEWNTDWWSGGDTAAKDAQDARVTNDPLWGDGNVIWEGKGRDIFNGTMSPPETRETEKAKTLQAVQEATDPAADQKKIRDNTLNTAQAAAEGKPEFTAAQIADKLKEMKNAEGLAREDFAIDQQIKAQILAEAIDQALSEGNTMMNKKNAEVVGPKVTPQPLIGVNTPIMGVM